MRTYLVTGGAGFIGSNYIHYMFDKYGSDIRIINVDKLTYAGNLENLKDLEDNPHYIFIKADVCDGEKMMEIFQMYDIDRVVHFAAESHVDRSIKNPDVFVKTNVADMDSLKNLIKETVVNFGALDTFVSNAGVVRAGDLEAMTPENFEFVTNINYKAYFFCAKVASHVMKLETAADPEYFADIVQINSKSGLVGSKANFAYAGGKFGGIGLTQSFALELAPFRIKVNSICPGNYYDGPLWSDPERGLFIQYLKAGKAPGAKTVQDVKDYYLSKVPMRKGCNPEDVCKAIMYAIEQTGETGQAIPVTGGQVMLA